MSAKRKRSKKDLIDDAVVLESDVQSATVDRKDSADAVAVEPDDEKVFVVVCQQVLKRKTEIKVFEDRDDAEEFIAKSHSIPIGNGRSLHREVLLCTTNIQPSSKKP